MSNQEISKVSHVLWDDNETRTSDVVIDTIEVINQMLTSFNIRISHEKSLAPNIVYIHAITMKEKK
jgi:hypothetical protein